MNQRDPYSRFASPNRKDGAMRKVITGMILAVLLGMVGFWTFLTDRDKD